jgi:5-methylcytosine-specific restriction endonuclease McrA
VPRHSLGSVWSRGPESRPARQVELQSMSKPRTAEQKARKAAWAKARSTPAKKAQDATRSREYHAAHPLTPEQKARKAELAKRTPEQKAERASRDRAKYALRTPEQKAERAARDRAHWQANRDELLPRQRAYYYTNRDELLPRMRAYREANKPALRAKEKARREANRPRVAARHRAYQNKKRAELRGCEIAPDVSPETYARIMAGDPACTYCPAPATHVDHVWPFDLYGVETDENLVPACATCNSDKKAKPLTEWSWAKVKYGVAHSPRVAAELARLEAECEAS